MTDQSLTHEAFLVPAPEKKRVMIVDDEPDIRTALGKVLTLAGYEVILAADGVEATRLWREREADLVILDLFMPNKEGIETLLELRAHSPGIAIIAMSGGGASNRMDVLEAARSLGAVATIEKPFDKRVVLDLVARSLAGGS